jgi:hypothetical protein
MNWTIQDYQHANHSPVLDVNGQVGTGPIYLDAKVGEAVILDASHSRDPDGQAIQYHWFHYPEAGSTEASLATVSIVGADTAKAIVTATATCRPGWLQLNRPCSSPGTAHIILQATDKGSPPLTSYRRIVLTVRQVEK